MRVFLVAAAIVISVCATGMAAGVSMADRINGQIAIVMAKGGQR